MSSSLRTLWRLLRLLRPFLGEVALSVALGACTIATAIGLMGTSAYIISLAALHPTFDLLQVPIVAVRFFGISRGAFRYAERLSSHSANFRLLGQLRSGFYRALEPLAPARLMDYRAGDLLARSVSDTDTLQDFYVRAVAPPFVALLVTVGMSLFLGRYLAPLGWILAGGLLLNGLLLPLLGYALGRLPGRALPERRAELNATLVDGIQGMPDLLAFGAGPAQAERVRRASLALSDTERRLNLGSSSVDALAQLICNLTLLAVLLVAIPAVSRGILDGVLLAMLALTTLSSFEAANPLPAAAHVMESCLQAGRRLFELADAPPAVVDPPQPRELPDAAESLTLEIHDLSFRYAPPLPPALEGLDLSMPPGKAVALVGPSGAGKSTLLGLLLRHWEYERGSIRLGGVELRDAPAESVRRCFGLISADTYVFSETLRQNLLLGRPEASDGELVEALRRAHLQEWAAALPQGLDTPLGEHGAHMSAGERQRLGVARALLLDAPIFLLDEPTANLDALTERALLADLYDAIAGRSLISVSHRLIEMERFDEILVLDHGHVLQRGTHAELLAQDGLYARLWEVQHRLLVDDASPQPARSF
jgi:thiol reductant ABC exporter CydC subunit